MSEPAKMVSNSTHRPAAAQHLPPILFIVAATLLWSTGGLFIKATSLSVFEVSLWRSLFAAATVAFFTRREGFRLNRVTALASVFYAGMLLLFVVATKLTTAANAIFIQYTAPIYIMILEPLLYKERFRARDVAVIVACVAGMSLFFVGRIEADGRLGNLAALVSGVCFALFALLLRHPKTSEVNRASSVIYGSLLLAAVAAAALLFAPSLTRSAGQASIGDFIAVAYLGVFQLGLAYTLFTLGIARGVRSLDAGIVGYVEPVLNPVWVFLFIGERPSLWALLGGAVIIAAVVLHTLYGAKARSAARNHSRAGGEAAA